MRLRTTAILATATAATPMVLLAGCGGSASEAIPSTATSTTAIRKFGGSVAGAVVAYCYPKCRGVKAIGANLTGADLTRAKLNGADLSGALLTSVDLTGANLTGANLSDAGLFGATWSSTTCPNGSVTNTGC